MKVNVKEVAKRVQLVTLNLGKPGFGRQNHKESEEIKQRNGMNTNTTDAKAIIKHCTHPALKAIEKLDGEIRVYHNLITQPTITEGMRMLPAGLEMTHAKKMTEFRDDRHKHSHDFMRDYPQLAADAPTNLGALWDAKVWLPEANMWGKFKFHVSLLPCPTEGRWADWLESSTIAAQQEVTEMLEAAIKRVAERCASDGKLYDSVFSNLKEVLDLVPHMNLTDDPRLKQIAAEAAKTLANQDREVLANKNNGRQRKAVAVEASRIASMFQGV